MHSKPELLQQEKDNLRKALTKCKYPKWALDMVEKRLNRSTSEVIDRVNIQWTTAAQAVTNEVKTKAHIVIPYTQSLCESIKKICGRYGIQTNFKGGSTIKNLLVSPKDKDLRVNQSDAIYWYQCGDLGCDDEYIGESSRVNNYTLNSKIGKFNLPHIWDRVLLNTKSLNLKRQVNNNNTQPN